LPPDKIDINRCKDYIQALLYLQQFGRHASGLLKHIFIRQKRIARPMHLEGSYHMDKSVFKMRSCVFSNLKGKRSGCWMHSFIRQKLIAGTAPLQASH